MNETVIKVLLALVPFVTLFGGFLILHWGSLRTVLVTCIVEFVIIVTYYQTSPGAGLEAAIWGSVAVWPTLFVTFTAQIFGHVYKQTGLMRVMLDSIGSLFPKKETEGRALALLGPISGVFANFEGRAAYPVIVPGLVELGYDPVKASAAALVFMTWVMPFASFMIGAIIANLATHIPIATIAVAVGQFAIPQVLICNYATFKVLGFRFFTRESQTLYWVTTLPYVISIFLFTQIWPQYYALSLFGGAFLNILSLYLYGQARKREPGANIVYTQQSLGAAVVAPSPPDQQLTWQLVLKGWGPLLIGFAYAAFMMSSFGAKALAPLTFSVSAWGFKAVNINLFNTPGMPILIGALSAYFFKTKAANAIADIATGLRRGVSPMLTFVFGVAIMYMLVATKQIDFLGGLLAHAGKTVFLLLDSAIIVFGGTIFGSGTPTIYTFGTMQEPVAAAFGVSLTLLLGLVVVGGIGLTNACKPPNVRFVTALLDLGAGRDWEVFRIGLKWVLWQVLAFTILVFILVPFWK